MSVSPLHSSLKHSSTTEVVISIHLWLISVDWFSSWSLLALGDRGSGPLFFFLLSFLCLFSHFFLFVVVCCSGFRSSSSLVDVGFDQEQTFVKAVWEKAQLEIGRLLGNSGLIRTWGALIFARILWNGCGPHQRTAASCQCLKEPMFLQAELLWVKPPFLILLTHFNQT